MAKIKALYLEISSGSGGQESHDWVAMLFNMYTKFLVKIDAQYDILHQYKTIAGLRSVSLLLKGKHIHLLEKESGVHRLIRISPFDSNRRRHTTFAYVYVYAPIEHKGSHHNLNPKDLRIDTYRSSGPGGQHVNKTDSAVRITHLPTGLKAEAQTSRSQHHNKEQALEQLQAKLAARYRAQHQQHLSSLRTEVNAKGCWSNYIRSYILDKPQVKDHRTNFVSHKPKQILQGNLLDLVKTLV